MCLAYKGAANAAFVSCKVSAVFAVHSAFLCLSVLLKNYIT